LPSPDDRPGALFIVGIGPGDLRSLTGRACDAIAASAYVIGNDRYLRSIEPLLDGKVIIRSGMGQEVARAREAVDLAREHVVSIVSGGDPGVYGMASIVLEVIEHSYPDLRVEIVPGVTAATAAAALAGSPLSGDFAVISLSDLLTPYEEIARRLGCAFAMGVPVVLYNPKSRGRPHHLVAAYAIARDHLPPETPVAIVRNVSRAGEGVFVTTLGEADAAAGEVDMHTTVIIGGTESRIWRNKDETVRGVITPRGYHRKYVY
jgi:precorrin-3B C17-methyltransferase